MWAIRDLKILEMFPGIESRLEISILRPQLRLEEYRHLGQEMEVDPGQMIGDTLQLLLVRLCCVGRIMRGSTLVLQNQMWVTERDRIGSIEARIDERRVWIQLGGSCRVVVLRDRRRIGCLLSVAVLKDHKARMLWMKM